MHSFADSAKTGGSISRQTPSSRHGSMVFLWSFRRLGKTTCDRWQFSYAPIKITACCAPWETEDVAGANKLFSDDADWTGEREAGRLLLRLIARLSDRTSFRLDRMYLDGPHGAHSNPQHAGRVVSFFISSPKNQSFDVRAARWAFSAAQFKAGATLAA